MSRLPVPGEHEAMPDTIIIDDLTGFSINVPLAYQDNVTPDIERRILSLRKEMGIAVAEPSGFVVEPASPITVTSSGRRQPKRSES